MDREESVILSFLWKCHVAYKQGQSRFEEPFCSQIPVYTVDADLANLMYSYLLFCMPHAIVASNLL